MLLTPVLTVLLLTFAHLCVRLDRAQRRAADEELPQDSHASETAASGSTCRP